MSKKQKTIYILIGVLVGILFSGCLAWFAGFQRWVVYGFPILQSQNGERVYNRGIQPGAPNLIHPSYPADFSNNRNLIGGASNVFIAKVISQIGNKETSVGPRTQYSVEIVRNIKGDLSGNVIVDQLGGLEDGQLSIVADSALEGYFLQSGSTYLLSTRYDEQEGWYTLNPHPNASKLLTSDVTASIGALKKLADTDPKTKELEAAYPNEYLLDADIAHANTRNAFRDLPEEVKAAARVRAEEARTSLESGSNMQ